MHSQQVMGVSYSTDGNYVASASYDGTIQISDATQQMQVVKTLHHDDKVVSVRWHPILPLLLSSGADKTARVWFPQVKEAH